MKDERFYVFYIDCRGLTPQQVTEYLKDTQRFYRNPANNLMREDERWVFLPSDRNELVCITPTVITDAQRSEEFINEFLDLKLKVEKELDEFTKPFTEEG